MVIETPRLILRDWREADIDAFDRHTNTENVMRWLGGVQTRAELEDRLRNRIMRWQAERGFTFWAVERKADGALMGMCGLVKRDTLPAVDIGYAFLPAFWGQGYAREAAAACLGYARDTLGLRRVLAITGPDNAASAGVLEAIGMTHEDTRTLEGEERLTRVFSIDF